MIRILIKNGWYGGLLFRTGWGDSYIEFTLASKIKIYAYSNPHSAEGNDAGKKAVVEKYDGEKYVNYKMTNNAVTTGKRYELVELEAGKYKMYAPEQWVGFDEWELEAVE